MSLVLSSRRAVGTPDHPRWAETWGVCKPPHACDRQFGADRSGPSASPGDSNIYLCWEQGKANTLPHYIFPGNIYISNLKTLTFYLGYLGKYIHLFIPETEREGCLKLQVHFFNHITGLSTSQSLTS